MKTAFIGLCSVVAMLAACDTHSQSESPQNGQRHTAPIIHNHCDGESAVRWVAREEVRVRSTADGPGHFTHVRHVDTDAEGLLYALAPTENALLVYAPTAHLIRRITLKQSPGCEEELPRSFWWDRDSALVVRYERCFARYAKDGRYLGHRLAPVVANVPPYVAMIGKGGAIREITSVIAVRPSGHKRWSLHPIAYNGNVVDSMPAVVTMVQTLPGKSTMDPATPRPILHIDSSDVLWFSSTRDYHVVARSLAGDTILEFTLDAAPNPLTKAERSEVANEWVPGEIVPEPRIPVTHQAIARITTDNTRRVIVFPRTLGWVTGSAADVFNSGVFQGRLRLPYALEVEHQTPVFAGGRVVGVTRESDGQSAVVSLRIVKRGD